MELLVQRLRDILHPGVWTVYQTGHTITVLVATGDKTIAKTVKDLLYHELSGLYSYKVKLVDSMIVSPSLEAQS